MFVYTERVGGSIPSPPTKFIRGLRFRPDFTPQKTPQIAFPGKSSAPRSKPYSTRDCALKYGKISHLGATDFDAYFPAIARRAARWWSGR